MKLGIKVWLQSTAILAVFYSVLFIYQPELALLAGISHWSMISLFILAVNKGWLK